MYLYVYIFNMNNYVHACDYVRAQLLYIEFLEAPVVLKFYASEKKVGWKPMKINAKTLLPPCRICP